MELPGGTSEYLFYGTSRGTYQWLFNGTSSSGTSVGTSSISGISSSRNSCAE